MTVTDDIDIACYSWDGNSSVVNSVSSEELEALPEWITDSINIGEICSYDGLMYGPSESSLIEEPLWKNDG